MLVGTGCSYRYPGSDRWVFRDIDFEITRGEFVMLRGRNGSGKSTLLKVMAGILRPVEGNVVISHDLHPIYMDQSAEEMLAFDLTVREQLGAFDRNPLGSNVRIRDSLQRFGLNLEVRLDEFIGHLSGGQRQIIALLAILEAGANLLCLDEFLSALDSRSAEIATKLIAELVANEDVAVIAASHSPLSISQIREIDLDGVVARA